MYKFQLWKYHSGDLDPSNPLPGPSALLSRGSRNESLELNGSWFAKADRYPR